MSFLLSTVHLRFQAGFVSVSLRPVLGPEAAYVVATVWPSPGGVSYLQDSSRTWLIALSAALEEELKALGFV